MCFPPTDSSLLKDIREDVGTCIPFLLDLVIRPRVVNEFRKEKGKKEGKGNETPKRSKAEDQIERLSWEVLRSLQELTSSRQVILSKLSLLMTSPNVAAQQFAEDFLISLCQKNDSKTCESLRNFKFLQ
jgi:hypothetical protein